MNRPHKKLDVWQLAMECTFDIYRITKTFPIDEKFGLTDQLRRASVSVPSNIAEGASRNTKKEFVNYLYIAQGSLSEIDTQLDPCRQ
jgi:four helix bundle protein